MRSFPSSKEDWEPKAKTASRQTLTSTPQDAEIRVVRSIVNQVEGPPKTLASSLARAGKKRAEMLLVRKEPELRVAVQSFAEWGRVFAPLWV